MTTPLAEFNRIRYAYERALTEATHARIEVWSLYRATIAHSDAPMWEFVDHYPSKADARLACPKDSHADHIVVREYLSAADKRYDVNGFETENVTDRFDGRLSGIFEIFPAQMLDYEQLPGRAFWIPCYFACAGGKALAHNAAPVGWIESPPPADGRYVVFKWYDETSE